MAKKEQNEYIKQVHDRLLQDEEIKDFIPKDVAKFSEKYTTPEDVMSLYEVLSDDEKYQDILPKYPAEMVDQFIGKKKDRSGKESKPSSDDTDRVAASQPQDKVDTELPKQEREPTINLDKTGQQAPSMEKDQETVGERPLVTADQYPKDKFSDLGRPADTPISTFLQEYDKANERLDELTEQRSESSSLGVSAMGSMGPAQPFTSDTDKTQADDATIDQQQMERRSIERKQDRVLDFVDKQSDQLMDDPESLIDKSEEGFKIPNHQVIGEKARNIAREYGVAEDGTVAKLIKRDLEQKVGYEIIRPDVEKKAKEIAQKEFGKSLEELQKEGKNKIEKEAGEIKAKAQNRTEVVQQELYQEAQKELGAKLAPLNNKVDSLKTNYKQQQQQIDQSVTELNNAVKQGQIDEETYQQKYEQLQSQFENNKEEYQKQFKQTQQAILQQANSIQSQYEEVYQKRAGAILEQANEKIKSKTKEAKSEGLNEENVAKIKQAYKDAYKQVLKEKKETKEITDEMINQMPGGFAMNHMRNTISAFGNAFAGISSSLDNEAGVTLGKAMADKFQPAPAKEEADWGDWFNPTELSRLTGQLMGSMTPSLVAAGATSIATQGLGAPVSVSLISSALAGWGGETLHIAGQMYEDTFEKTGSTEQASKNAKESLNSQVLLMPAYAFEGLPFIGKALRGVKNPIGKMLIGGGVEVGTEFTQEYPQESFEEAIRENKAFQEGFENMTAENAKNTFIRIGPVAALGAGAQAIHVAKDKHKEGKVKDFIRDLDLKAKVGEYSESQMDEFLSQVDNAKGVNFTTSMITSLYTDGTINEGEYSRMMQAVGNSHAAKQSAKKLKLQGGAKQAYTSLYAKKKDLEGKIQNENDEAVVSKYKKDLQEVNNQMESLAKNKNADFAVLRYNDNSHSILSLNEFEELIEDPEIQQKLKDGEIEAEVNQFQEEERINKIYERVREIVSPQEQAEEDVAEKEPTEAEQAREVDEVSQEESQSIKEKKADIEKRRQEELERRKKKSSVKKRMFTTKHDGEQLEIVEHNDGTYSTYVIDKNGNRTKQFNKENRTLDNLLQKYSEVYGENVSIDREIGLEEEINAKYDAELEALEQQKEGGQDAIQEQEAEKVSPREEAEAGEEVGQEVRGEGREEAQEEEVKEGTKQEKQVEKQPEGEKQLQKPSRFKMKGKIFQFTGEQKDNGDYVAEAEDGSEQMNIAESAVETLQYVDENDHVIKSPVSSPKNKTEEEGKPAQQEEKKETTPEQKQGEVKKETEEESLAREQEQLRNKQLQKLAKFKAKNKTHFTKDGKVKKNAPKKVKDEASKIEEEFNKINEQLDEVEQKRVEVKDVPYKKAMRNESENWKKIYDAQKIDEKGNLESVNVQQAEQAAKEIKESIQKRYKYDYPDEMSARAETEYEGELEEVDNELSVIKRLKNEVGRDYETAYKNALNEKQPAKETKKTPLTSSKPLPESKGMDNLISETIEKGEKTTGKRTNKETNEKINYVKHNKRFDKGEAKQKRRIIEKLAVDNEMEVAEILVSRGKQKPFRYKNYNVWFKQPSKRGEPDFLEVTIEKYPEWQEEVGKKEISGKSRQKSSNTREQKQESQLQKPNKQVKANQTVSVNDVVEGYPEYNTLSKMHGGMLYSNFRNNSEIKAPDDPKGLLSQALQKMEEQGYVEYDIKPENTEDTYTLTEQGQEFVDRVKARYETRKGVKEGTDMFPETANIEELKQNYQQAKQKEEQAEEKLQNNKGKTQEQVQKEQKELVESIKDADKASQALADETEKQQKGQGDNPNGVNPKPKQFKKKSQEQLLKEAKTMEDLMAMYQQGLVKKDKAFDERQEQLRKQTTKESSKGPSQGTASKKGMSVKPRKPLTDKQKREQQYKLYERTKEFVKKHTNKLTERPPGKIQGLYHRVTGNIHLRSLNNIFTALHEVVHAVEMKTNFMSKIMKTVGTDARGNPKYDQATKYERKALTDIYENEYPGGKRTHSLEKRMREGLATFLTKYVQDPVTMNYQYPQLRDMFLKEGGKYYYPRLAKAVQEAQKIEQEFQDLTYSDQIRSRITDGDRKMDKDTKIPMHIHDKLSMVVADNIWGVEKTARKTGVSFTPKDPTTALRMMTYADRVFGHNMNRTVDVKKGFLKTESHYIFVNGGFQRVYEFNWKTLFDKLHNTGVQEWFGTYLVARRVKSMYDQLNDLEQQANEAAQQIQKLNEQKQGPDPEVDKQIQDLQADINEYLDLLEIINNNNITQEQAEGTLQELEELFGEREAEARAKKGDKKAASLNELTEMYDQLVRADLDMLYNNGFIKPEKYEKLKKNKGYATFMRSILDEFQTTDKVGSIRSKVGGNKISSLMKMKGSEKVIVNPLFGAVLNHEENLKKAVKQNVWNRVGNLEHEWADYIEREDLQVHVGADGRVSFPQVNDENYLIKRTEGRMIPFKINSDLKTAMDNFLDTTPPDAFTQFFRIFTRLFTKGTTGFFPFFGIYINPAMDTVAALQKTRTGYFPLVSQLKIMYEHMSKSDPNIATYANEYLHIAGNFHTLAGMYDKDIGKMSQKIRQETNALKKINDLLSQGLNVWSLPAQTSEIATRITEYIRARQQGYEQAEALELAGLVSAPFHHRGSMKPDELIQGVKPGKSLDIFYAMYPFFKAANVAIDASIKSLSQKGRMSRAWGVLGSLVAAQAAYTIAMGLTGTDEQRKKMDDMSPEALAMYFIYPKADGRNLGRIRLPEELGSISAVVNMAIWEAMSDTDYSAGEYMDAALAFIPQQFRFDETFTIEFLMSWFPHAAKPATEVGFNTVTWPEARPLESPSMKYKAIPERAYKSTPEAYKWLSQNTPIGDKNNITGRALSPIQLEHLTEGYLGRVTRIATEPKKQWQKMKEPFRMPYYFTAGRNVQRYYEIREATNVEYNKIEKGTFKGTAEEKLDVLENKKRIDGPTFSKIRSRGIPMENWGLDMLLKVYEEYSKEQIKNGEADYVRDLILQKIHGLEEVK